MVDIKAKLRATFTRRHSGLGSLSTESSTGSNNAEPQRKASLVSRSSDRASLNHPGSPAMERPPRSSGSHQKSYFPITEFDRKKRAASTRSTRSNRDEDDSRDEKGSIRLPTIVDADGPPEPASSTPMAPTDLAAAKPEGEKTEGASSSSNVGPGRGLGGQDGVLEVPQTHTGASPVSGNDHQHQHHQHQHQNPSSADARMSTASSAPAPEPPSEPAPAPTAIVDASEGTETDSSVPADAAASSTNDSASTTTDDDDGLAANDSTRDSDAASTTPRLASAIPATPLSSSTAVTVTPRPPPPVARPSGPQRRQSLLPNRQTTLIRTLLTTDQLDDLGAATNDHLLPLNATMVTRKIWVKRPGASATLVTINEDDLVDDVRDMILRKYGNSLGRQFDAPDITLRIVPREKRMERPLGPEEPMSRTLDAYYPGGQSVDEALIIDVPLGRRTPRASPRTGPPHASHLTSVYYDEIRPSDASTDYFGPNVGPVMPVTLTAPSTGSHASHSISVLSTGQVPQLPSPGGTRSRNYRERPDRPRLGRQHTSSPTIIGLVSHQTSLAGAAVGHGILEHSGAPPPPAPPPMSTPPGAVDMSIIPSMVPIQRTLTPPPRQASPRPLVPQQTGTGSSRPRRRKNADSLPAPLPTGVLNSGVPPINVLIVEDNIINLKLLEAFVKRLKVRWQTAMNGREAVTKWRAGGFHLVLMDIQLPIMSGLDATREIRRLERVNSIGVFSGSAADAVAAARKPKPAVDKAKVDAATNSEGLSSVAGATGAEADKAQTGDLNPEDELPNLEVFKSPVIIVALTASSLQSDRHEALAAGCNDFLTKPVNFVWLERKVMEWGCMQALIDYDGWRKWKDFSHAKDELEGAKKPSKPRKIKNRLSITSPG